MAQKKRLKSFLLSLARSLSVRSSPADRASFRLLFERFKSVLDSNNRAIETITDMGEKLGGDYLFDIVYVRNEYRRLKNDMGNSLRAFDTLTANRYPRLHEAFDRIDELIGQVLTETDSTPAALISFLKDIPWGSTRQTGGKMAQLAEVKNQLGISVPDGFVITTAAFSEFVKFNNLEQYLDRLRQGQMNDSELEELRELVLQGNIPPGLRQDIRKALHKLGRHASPLLSLRSSAEEEDSTHSFAGQFRSVLGVPSDSSEVEMAYRKVIASLFSEKAVAYQRQTGFEPGSMRMAVGCMVMADAAASGVVYTVSPEGDPDTMIISAAWGLGESIVEARTGTDLYRVRKGKQPALASSAIGRKETKVILDRNGGTVEVPVEAEQQNKACLAPEQAAQLAVVAARIERYFGTARDIEWALDKSGRLWILQARPLQVQAERNGDALAAVNRPVQGHPVILEAGSIVQQGAGAGKVFLVGKPADLPALPRGAVLVASHDSSLFVRSMPYVSAIVTETGSLTSHMAAVCRELKIPTIVNVPGATRVLEQGQEITVLAGGDGARIYSGLIPELVAGSGQDGQTMEAVYEFRQKRYLLRYVSPLHLIDPLMDDFIPERCRTMHDILRFMHEKSVAELVERAREGSVRLRRRGTLVPLDLPVPAGLLVMDMGGGLREPGSGRATAGDIASVPFRAIITGMVHPGAWHSEPVALRTGDFISSMIRMPDITAATGSTAGYNVAVISREYMNMSIRFGYHFNMVDCYCSEKAKNNHIYFRFAGGATDLTKRSRRLDLIGRILSEYGFAVKIKGDLLIGRLAGLGSSETVRVLDQVGRLVSYARQLDAVLRDDRDIDAFAAEFLAGNYDPVETEAGKKD